MAETVGKAWCSASIGSPNRWANRWTIWRIWTICFDELAMNEVRHSQGSWRMTRRPRCSRAAWWSRGSLGKVAKILGRETSRAR